MIAHAERIGQVEQKSKAVISSFHNKIYGKTGGFRIVVETAERPMPSPIRKMILGGFSSSGDELSYAVQASVIRAIKRRLILFIDLIIF